MLASIWFTECQATTLPPDCHERYWTLVQSIFGAINYGSTDLARGYPAAICTSRVDIGFKFGQMPASGQKR
jgi:hypothetical protein